MSKTTKQQIADLISDDQSQAYMAKRQSEIDLAIKIKRHRERLGLTQRQLAEKMGVPQPTIVRMESGEAGISSTTLEKFCLVAGLELNFTSANTDKNPVEIAEYVLVRCYDVLGERYDLTILKLLKLVYYIQAKYLGMYQKPLIAHNFQAWDRGPVHVDLYQHYKNPLEPTRLLLPSQKEFNLNKAEKNLIDEILFEFEGGLAYKSAYELVERTHEEAPWKNAYNKGNTTQIEIQEIIEYYTNRI
jgi:uncharacterized phage-associated protein/DNA-binding XRE family transcriptional regulator